MSEDSSFETPDRPSWDRNFEADVAASLLVRQIVADLGDRSGLDHVWESIDEDVQREIISAWTQLATDRVRHAMSLRDARLPHLPVRDPAAQDLLWEYARRRRPADPAFSDALEGALREAGCAPRALGDNPAMRDRP